MPLTPIKLRPGITTEPTSLLNEGGWSESGNIRWLQGLPEKLGGFIEFASIPSSAGLPQKLQPWTALSGLAWLGIASQRRLYVFGSEQVSDITPLTKNSSPVASLSTTAGSPDVFINDPANVPGLQATSITSVVAPGDGYAPDDTITLAGGSGVTVPTQLTVSQTEAVSATIVSGGSGGTPGATTITGTTGTGTLFQASGVINASGGLTGALTVTLLGSYTANPTDVSAEPVTTSDGLLTGATVALGMGVLAATISVSGDYQTAPANPVAQASTSGSGTGATFDLTYAIDQWLQIHDPVSVSNIVLLGSYLISAATPSVGYTIITAINAAATVSNGGYCRQFFATAGSNIVRCYQPNHGLFTGQVTSSPDPLAIGVSGVTLLGNYLATVIDQNNFTIQAAMTAVANDSVLENGGEIQIAFLDPPTGGSQVGFNASASSSLANWGEFLMWCPVNAPVYLWQPAMGPSTPAAVIQGAPQNNAFIFVSSQQEILFCLGTVNRATNLFDPMLLAWSDQGDYTDFIPSVTNQAGSFRLTIGSKIIGGLAVAGAVLIWTDLALYLGTYLGQPLIWGFQPVGINYGLSGPNAFGILGSLVLWRGPNQFFSLQPGGVPEGLPCPVWDAAFKTQSRANAALTVCETNSAFNEIAWEVPQDDGTVTRAKVQIDTNLWDYTSLPLGAATPRTAWTDQSVFGMPLGADADGVIWQHEIGTDAGDEPLEWFLLTGQIMIAEGDEMTFFRNILPDFKFTASGGPGPGVVEVLVYIRDRPQSPPRVKGPYPVTSTTRYLRGARGRGRTMQFEFRGRDLGSWARLGLTRYRGAPDGRR